MTLHAQLTSILKDYQANHADTWAKDSFGNFVMYTLTDLAKYEHSESPSKELYLARRINSNLEHVEHKGEVTAEATRLSLLHTRLKAVIDAAIYPLEKKNLEANPPRTLDEFLAHYEALTDKPGFPSRAEFCKEHATLLKACVKSASHLTRFNVDVLELYSREEINALLIADNPFEGYSPTPLLLACHFRSDAIVRFLLTDETIDVNQSLLQPRIIPRHTEYHNSDTPHVYGNPNDPLSEPYTLYNSRNGYYQKPVDVPEQTLTVSPAGTPLQAACRANRKETIMLLANHRSFELSAADFVEILRKSDSHFDHESFSLLLTKVSPLTPEQFSLAFIHLCQDNKIEKLELFLAHYPEMKLTEQEQLAVLKVASRKNNKELYDKLLSQYPDVNLSSLLVDSHSRAFVLQQIKAENKNVGQVLSAMNQVSDKAQCTQIFKQQIQHLTLEELIELSKIMRAIQQQNISTEYMPDAANVCIKNLVALREETFGFTYHQDTDVWLELVDALKWQMSMHIQALMVAPLALADNPTPPINERFTSCLHFFQLQSSRETATSHSYGEATKFLQEKLDSPVAQFK